MCNELNRKIEVIFVRHGESESNAGIASFESDSVALTQKGVEQAQEFAKKFEQLGYKAVTALQSKFKRSQQTASYFCKKFDMLPVTVDAHEFSYLDFSDMGKTTYKQRTPRREAYWSQADPLWRDKRSESFADLMRRARSVLDYIEGASDLYSIKKEQEKKEVTVVFCHGHFMRSNT